MRGIWKQAARKVLARPGVSVLASTSLLIAVTGWGNPSDRQQCLDAGFDQHFVKPVTLEQLRAAMESHTAV